MSGYRLFRRRQEKQSGVRRLHRQIIRWWLMDEPPSTELALRLAGVR